MQISLDFDTPKPAPLTLSQVPLSKTFRFTTSTGRADKDIFIRVKATGFLLNSSVIGDVLNRGDCLVVNLSKHTLYAKKGDSFVELVDAIVAVKESGK